MAFSSEHTLSSKSSLEGRAALETLQRVQGPDGACGSWPGDCGGVLRWGLQCSRGLKELSAQGQQSQEKRIW